MRVLLLEDDEDLADVVALGLRDAAYAVDHAPDLATARALLAGAPYDVACIDLGLPDGDGLDLVTSMAGEGGDERPGRIIILTARDAVEQRVAGLDAGADDYLVKPFAFDELLARVRALGRRADQPETILRSGDIVLDPTRLTVTRDSRPVELTPREFSLLRYLMVHSEEVLSAEHLLEHVWDANADPFTSSVRVIMSRLRQKLGPPSVIHTVRTAGYRLGGDS